MELAVDDHGVDHVAHIVHGDVPQDRGLAGLAVDLDDAHVRAEGEGAVGRIEDRGRL